MKISALLLTLTLSFSIFAKDQDKRIDPNELAKYESKLRKVEGELYLRNKQVLNSTKQIKQLNNMYSSLMSQHRQLTGEAQYLKFQNDQLIHALKKADSYTPELAEKMKKLKGRLPASIPSPKK